MILYLQLDASTSLSNEGIILLKTLYSGLFILRLNYQSIIGKDEYLRSNTLYKVTAVKYYNRASNGVGVGGPLIISY